MSNTATELSQLIQTLQLERQQHVDAVSTIDAAFASLGIAVKAPARRGRKPGRPKGLTTATAPSRKRRRQKAKDGMTGEQFLQSILSGAKLTTAGVNKKWKESGRKGVANNLLGKLVKGGKVKRAEVKGERGGVYSAA